MINPLVQTSEKIKYLVLSDIHLGHKRNTTREILFNLTVYLDYLSPNSRFKDLDILFIAGDLFDQAMWVTDDDVVLIQQFASRLMKMCEHFGIRLRILEGTPSHDNHQPRILVPLAATYKKLDFRYVETMCIESFTDLGITCLYMPDEFGGSALEAQRLIQEEMDNLHLEQVDIAILHGMFKYQLPEIASERFKLDEEFFLKRVKAFINIGHVHIYTTYERILAQGSFDRLSHGEEGPKGAIYIELHPQGNSFYFVENTRAKKFVTCHVKTPDLEKAVAQVRKIASKLPDDAYLRIKTTKSHPVFTVFDMISKEFLMLTFTKITEEEESERQQLLDGNELLDMNYTPVQIHKENIVEMIMTEMRNNANQDNIFAMSDLLVLEQQLKDLV